MSSPHTSPRLGVIHCAATGAAVLVLLFLLFWATAAVADPKASQEMLVFLTQQSLRTPAHAMRGLSQALVIGGLVGALVAICYNALKFLNRR